MRYIRIYMVLHYALNKFVGVAAEGRELVEDLPRVSCYHEAHWCGAAGSGLQGLGVLGLRVQGFKSLRA